MKFKNNPNVILRQDPKEKVRIISHLQAPYTAGDGLIGTPQSLGINYLSEVADIYELQTKELNNLGLAPLKKLNPKLGNELRFLNEKKVHGTTTLEYAQTYFGLPIWQAGVAVTVHKTPMRVSSSVSSLHYDVKVAEPKSPKLEVGLDLKKASGTNSFNKVFGIKGESLKKESKRPKINSTRQLIYRYDSINRKAIDVHEDFEGKKHAKSLDLPLPPVSKSIKAGEHYIVTEVLFTYTVPKWGPVNWRAFIEPETESVLYLEAFVHGASGMIFECDPLTQTNDGTITPSSSSATLNPLRTSVTFDVDAPSGSDPSELKGEYISITETNAPTVASPSSGSGTFNFNADSDNFTAVNAYYHLDAIFEMMESMGFDVKGNYFSGTNFPIPVDHRGEGGDVNAHHHGSATGTGTAKFRFGLASSGDPVGIAADVRVVLHEFGHALLQNNTGSGKFLFAHSAGDAMAAILKDSDTQLSGADRFMTFPWILPSRRHDRDVTSGFAWGGASDNGASGYNAEQILSTTLFRAYRSVGGDDHRLAVREFAARYMSFLIIKAIGTLTPTVNAADNEAFALALQNSDIGTDDFEGHPGGAFHKVIRWAFEKQGSFQPAGAPTPVTTEGAAPDVDVYIDDGRNGEYGFQRNFWNTTDIWNRLSIGDGGGVHETPIIGTTNYLYVKVKNRGSLTAENVNVSCFHNRPGVGLIYPNSWQPTDTPSLTAPDIPASGEVIVGPFLWTPAIEDHECLLAMVDADGDLSNANNISGAQSIPHWRLVPFDNNISQRNVKPEPGGGGSGLLAESMQRVKFWVTNPFPERATIDLEPEIPEVLRKKGWNVRFLNAGGNRFTLASHEEQEVVFTLEAGHDFTAQELGGMQEINIYTYAKDLLVGGMTYQVDPNLKHIPKQTPSGTDSGTDCSENAGKLLDCLDLCIPEKKIGKVKVTKITLDIEISDC